MTPLERARKMVRETIIRANSDVDPRTCDYILVFDGDLISLAYVDDANSYALEHVETFILVPHA